MQGHPRNKQPQKIWFGLYEMSRTGKSIQTESARTAVRGWRGGRMRHDCFKWQGTSFWSDENILKLDSSDGCTALGMHSSQWNVHFRGVKMVHFMLYEFYHNKQKRDCVLPSSQRYTKLCHNHSIEDWKGLSLLKSGRHYPNVTVTGRRQSCVPRDSRSSWPHLPEGTRVVWVPRRRQNPVQKSL